MAAKLAVGYALEEIPNDITLATPASFEPDDHRRRAKVPRFASKIPAPRAASTRMQSVGEVMAIGRTFGESFAKADALARARTPRSSRRAPTRICWRRSQSPAPSAST